MKEMDLIKLYVDGELINEFYAKDFKHIRMREKAPIYVMDTLKPIPRYIHKLEFYTKDKIDE